MKLGLRTRITAALALASAATAVLVLLGAMWIIGGIATTGSAAKDVLGSAAELARQSQTLRSEVDRFLAHIRAA